MTNEHLIGTHGVYGACAPDSGHQSYSTWVTFSVGVYEILGRKSGAGTKKGPVKVRVKGPVAQPELVYAKAREIAKALDEGTYKGPKTVTVKAVN